MRVLCRLRLALVVVVVDTLTCVSLIFAACFLRDLAVVLVLRVLYRLTDFVASISDAGAFTLQVVVPAALSAVVVMLDVTGISGVGAFNAGAVTVMTVMSAVIAVLGVADVPVVGACIAQAVVVVAVLTLVVELRELISTFGIDVVVIVVMVERDVWLIVVVWLVLFPLPGFTIARSSLSVVAGMFFIFSGYVKKRFASASVP